MLNGPATSRMAAQPDGKLRAPLETNVPAVFAVGDVRSGSVKRVDGANGLERGKPFFIFFADHFVHAEKMLISFEI